MKIRTPEDVNRYWLALVQETIFNERHLNLLT